MSRKIMAIATLALLGTALAGCTASDDDTLTLVFTQTDDDLVAEKDPQLLADFLSDETGHDVEILFVQNAQAAIEAMRAGHADAGFFDGAVGWFTWNEFGFEAIAADVNSDGRDYYIASAWVNKDRGFDSMASLEGARSCHTGLMKSAGMFMPLGWMIKEDLVDVVGPADDVASIEPTVQSYFSEASIPSDGPYSGYAGALRCLSEGMGDVAFIKDSTVASYCTDKAESWCLPSGQYMEIQQFGQVPSHPVMVRSDLDAHLSEELQNGLLALNEKAPAILTDVLETDSIVATTSTAHLGQYGDNVQYVPGFQTYVDGKLD